MNYSWLYKNGVIAVIVGLFFSAGAADRCTKMSQQVTPLPIEERLVNAYNQGEAFFTGQGVTQNFARARDSFTFVATNDQAPDEMRSKVFFRLGEIAFSGDVAHGVAKNYKVAADCFEIVLSGRFAPFVPAAVKAYAIGRLADLYFDGGHGLAKNYFRSLHYLDLALSNDHVSLAAKSRFFYLQGVIYMQGGDGVEKNFDTAKKCFAWTCMNPNLHPHFTLLASLHLGQMYLFGGYGVVKNSLQAQKYFTVVYSRSQNLPDEKHIFAQANYYLGYINYEGILGHKNYQKARDYFKKVVEEGGGVVSSIRAQAHYCLGVIFFEGGHPNVRRDYKNAAENFSVALNIPQGLTMAPLRAKAHYYRGLIYSDGGPGVRQDCKKAQEDMEQALKCEALPQELKDKARSILAVIEENEQAHVGNQAGHRTSKRLRKK